MAFLPMRRQSHFLTSAEELLHPFDFVASAGHKIRSSSDTHYVADRTCNKQNSHWVQS